MGDPSACCGCCWDALFAAGACHQAVRRKGDGEGVSDQLPAAVRSGAVYPTVPPPGPAHHSPHSVSNFCTRSCIRFWMLSLPFMATKLQDARFDLF